MGSQESDDTAELARLGYRQELHRVWGTFTNFALSLSIICILAGGITSFHVGLASAGGAAVALGWALGGLFSLAVALTMGQVASAFPTAGGLYHWAAILGGRGWGWTTAWFNLAGLITVLAAINVGAVEFTLSAFGARLGLGEGLSPLGLVLVKLALVALLTAFQGVVNHRGATLTGWLTGFSGYWILLVSVVLTGSLLWAAPAWDFGRLVRFENFSGRPAAEPVWPAADNLAWVFCLGLLLPAYTLTGFDASAHAAEETRGAARAVPLAIVRSVLVSAVFGWFLLAAALLAAPDLGAAVQEGGGAFVAIVRATLPGARADALLAAVALAQYLCGLATVTSASRMLYAFARDGGVPASAALRRVNPTFGTPVAAIWAVCGLSVLFTVYTPVYTTITSVCVLFLYISYAIPAGLGLFAYRRSWRHMGPWDLGWFYRPLAALTVLGCVGLFVVGIQPPNDRAFVVVAGLAVLLAFAWWGWEGRRFRGPPLLAPLGPFPSADQEGQPAGQR